MISGDMLRKLQMTELEILLKVDEICRKNNIKYFLVGGTLLGAVRHQGFIPWDDDLDIAMPRADYQKFVEISSKALGSQYHFQCVENDADYWLLFGKVRKNGTVFAESRLKNIQTNKGIFIDVFPLDDGNEPNDLLQKIRIKTARKIQYVMYCRRGVIAGAVSSQIKILAKLSRVMSINKWMRLGQKIVSHKNRNAKYYFNVGSNYNYKKQTILKEKYYPLKELEFEGHRFWVPNDYDFVLKQIFGTNYMELPEKEKRVNHAPEYISF